MSTVRQMRVAFLLLVLVGLQLGCTGAKDEADKAHDSGETLLDSESSTNPANDSDVQNDSSIETEPNSTGGTDEQGDTDQDIGPDTDFEADSGSDSVTDNNSETESDPDTFSDQDPYDISRCMGDNLAWKTGTHTWYESYPDPDSEECIEYNGCFWEGMFAACPGKMDENWVAAHNIVSAFPNFAQLRLHDLCLRSGEKYIVVTVLDTCGDGDCGGCCTKNLGSNEQLIDVESYTEQRWGISAWNIQWADLGPTLTEGCN